MCIASRLFSDLCWLIVYRLSVYPTDGHQSAIDTTARGVVQREQHTINKSPHSCQTLVCTFVFAHLSISTIRLLAYRHRPSVDYYYQDEHTRTRQNPFKNVDKRTHEQHFFVDQTTSEKFPSSSPTVGISQNVRFINKSNESEKTFRQTTRKIKTRNKKCV